MGPLNYAKRYPREGLGGNVPTRKFEGMDSLMLVAARLLRVLEAGRKKMETCYNFIANFAIEINFEHKLQVRFFAICNRDIRGLHLKAIAHPLEDVP